MHDPGRINSHQGRVVSFLGRIGANEVKTVSFLERISSNEEVDESFLTMTRLRGTDLFLFAIT